MDYRENCFGLFGNISSKVIIPKMLLHAFNDDNNNVDDIYNDVNDVHNDINDADDFDDVTNDNEFDFIFDAD